MKLKRIILENFRSYRDRTVIEIDNLTCVIGKNDAGKSTILEALDIFFEGNVVKIDQTDASVDGDPKNVRIGVVFSDLPEQLVLDSDALTTLQAEKLLNESGELEIHKIFNCANQTPKADIFAHAAYPSVDGAKDLLLKSQTELRKVVKERGLQDHCNQAENPSMRIAIYESFEALEETLQFVPLSKDNGKTVFKSLQAYMPMFALFQSDRPSKDQDPEVQNPMKIAVEQALEGLEDDLNNILDEIQTRARDTANRTLEKLGENYPEIATTLEPKFKKPAWKNIFKMDLEGDQGIPVNKRGSGVRRLILLSFFQAEAERRRLNDGNGNRRPILYAIEEPETSQHPDNQLKILDALSELASTGDQVLLTTHVPALAGKIPLECLRFVDRDIATQHVRVRSGADDQNVFEEIAEALGVYPDAIDSSEVQVAVLVEGKTDIDALQSMIAVLAKENVIEPIDDSRIFWTIGGGDTTLRDWVERRYLDRLGLPQVIIQDSDRTSNSLPVQHQKTQWLEEMDAKGHISAFLTQKRCMDNYLHPETIKRLTGGIVELPADTDLDFHSLSSILSTLLTEARANKRQTGFDYRPTEHDGTAITGTKQTACKRIICAHVMRNMTSGELLERSKYELEGQDRCEVQEWIEAIRQHL